MQQVAGKVQVQQVLVGADLQGVLPNIRNDFPADDSYQLASREAAKRKNTVAGGLVFGDHSEV